jgi:hypothetical protein
MSTEITREQWLKALGEADAPLVNEPGVMTRAELCALFGRGHSATQERITKLVAAGKATRTWKWIVDGSGRRQRVPAYRLVQGE